MAPRKATAEQLGPAPSNDGHAAVQTQEPYIVTVEIEGVCPILFHRWSNEAVEAKAKAAKGSTEKKSDNVESYVWRDEKGTICLPGEYLRMAIVETARYRQDPRSPRKSARDLYKAGVICLTELAPLGKDHWDYLDQRRVLVQRNAITRSRPAFFAGWAAEFQLMVQTPEYITRFDLQDTLTQAGRLTGLGDFRPTYGRYAIRRFE